MAAPSAVVTNLKKVKSPSAGFSSIRALGKQHWMPLLVGTAAITGTTILILKARWDHQQQIRYQLDLTERFQQVSQTTPELSYLYLEQNNWDIRQALRVFFSSPGQSAITERPSDSLHHDHFVDFLETGVYPAEVTELLSDPPSQPETSWSCFGKNLFDTVFSFLAPIESESHEHFQTRWSATYKIV